MQQVADTPLLDNVWGSLRSQSVVYNPECWSGRQSNPGSYRFVRYPTKCANQVAVPTTNQWANYWDM